MICMILVHMFSWWGNAYPNFNKYTGVFFLVFFFFASGVCFKAVPWKDYVIKRFKRLLLPYYIYCVIYAAYLWVIRGQFNGMSLPHRLYVIAVSTIECFPTGMTQVDFFHVDTYGVGPIWFVHCIFFANIFYRIICRWKYRLPIAMVAALLAALTQRLWVLPFNLQDAVIGCMFIAMGGLCPRAVSEGTEVAERAMVSPLDSRILCPFRGVCPYDREAALSVDESGRESLLYALPAGLLPGLLLGHPVGFLGGEDGCF